MRAALASPAAGHGHENLGQIVHELFLLFRRELHHAEVLCGVAQCGEDLSSHTKVGMVHVRFFSSFRKAEGKATESVWLHGAPSVGQKETTTTDGNARCFVSIW